MKKDTQRTRMPFLAMLGFIAIYVERKHFLFLLGGIIFFAMFPFLSWAFAKPDVSHCERITESTQRIDSHGKRMYYYEAKGFYCPDGNIYFDNGRWTNQTKKDFSHNQP